MILDILALLLFVSLLIIYLGLLIFWKRRSRSLIWRIIGAGLLIPATYYYFQGHEYVAIGLGFAAVLADFGIFEIWGGKGNKNNTDLKASTDSTVPSMLQELSKNRTAKQQRPKP